MPDNPFQILSKAITNLSKRIRALETLPRSPGILHVLIDSTSTPPTDAELNTILGSPTVATGLTRILDVGGLHTNVYIIISDGANWWYVGMTKAT